MSRRMTWTLILAEARDNLKSLFFFAYEYDIKTYNKFSYPAPGV